MFSKINFHWIILLSILFPMVPSFSGEVYRWTDERGTVHFTDDRSKIPESYLDQIERTEFPEEIFKEEGFRKPGEMSDPVKKYLESLEKKIEMKKKLEKRISELEEELKVSEERLKRIERYETEDYSYYMPFKDPRTGKWIAVASPYYGEKRELKIKIESIEAELNLFRERLSEIMRGL